MTYYVACVASVPVQGERSLGHGKEFSHSSRSENGARAKRWNPLPSTFLLSQFFARPECEKLLCAARISVRFVRERLLRRLRFMFFLGCFPGGVPYPTLTNRELCGLLKTGYRMERPDMCSDEV